MRYPLDNWHALHFGYTFGMPTHYSNFHLGLDVIVPNGTALYAPEDGRIVSTLTGKELGKTIQFLGKSGVLWRFGHLSTMALVGECKEGMVIGSTDTTGSLAGKIPHLHFDISKNGKLELLNRANFIDPETYLNSHIMSNDQYNESIVHSVDQHYALVIRGKKYEFKNPDTAGLILWMNRNKLGNFHVGALPNDIYNAIPDSDGLKF